MSGTGKIRSRACKSPAAFTMIELLIVAVIIGVLIAVAVPRISGNFAAMQLNTFAADLQSLMNYLHDRSVVERKAIVFHLDIDDTVENKELWAQSKGDGKRLKSRKIPDGISISSDRKDTWFYPDGTIDKVTIVVTGRDKGTITLTTEGVFGGVKIKE